MRTQDQTAPGSAGNREFLGWRMVVLGFLAVNLAIGTTFGTWGVLVEPVSTELGASRSLASLGLAIVLLLMGLAGPVLGALLKHVRLQTVMIAGALLMAAGFFIASKAESFGVFLLGYSLIAGAGCALLGIIPASTLIANWFEARRGLAMGLINIPLLVAVGPVAVAWLAAQFGWRSALEAVAALMIATLPLLFFVVDRPEDRGQQPLGGSLGGSAAPAHGGSPGSISPLLRDTYFWGILLSVGLITCGGIVISSHLVPYATGHGIEATRAALLLTINGSASMAGALACGWIADRIGARITCALLGIVLAGVWGLLVAFPRFEVMCVLLLGTGLCSGGLQPAFTTLLANAFGREVFASALGIGTLLMLPLTFSAAPLAGAIYDATGSYAGAFLLQVGFFLAAALILLAVFGRRAR